jgi:group I intron endonuclease
MRKQLLKHKTGGVYQILNLVNGKRYIGQSIDLLRRKNDHMSSLRNGKHWNTYLQNSFNKYGEENFLFNILIYCENFELVKYETFFDNFYKNLGLSYNIRKITESNKGMKYERSEEYCKNVSSWLTGRNVSEETRQKLRENHKDNSGEKNGFFGKKHTEETRDKISSGVKRHLENNSPPMLGRKHSDDTKKKISNAGMGRKASEETRKKRSESMNGKTSPMKGKHQSEESRKKISEGLKKSYENKRNASNEE